MATPKFKLGDTIYFYKNNESVKTFRSGVISKISYDFEKIEYSDNTNFSINDIDYNIYSDRKKAADNCLDDQKSIYQSRIDVINTAKTKTSDDNYDISKIF